MSERTLTVIKLRKKRRKLREICAKLRAIKVNGAAWADLPAGRRSNLDCPQWADSAAPNEGTMRKITLIAALAAATAFTAPAMAAEAGTIQVKVLATGVLPDGKIDKIKDVDLTTPFGATAAGALPASTKANDNVVPTVAIEYFATPNARSRRSAASPRTTSTAPAAWPTPSWSST